MKTITTIGLDIAKSVFQVHGIDAAGDVVIRQQLKRARVMPFFKKLPPCVVGIEACASSHHWARELTEPSDEHEPALEDEAIGMAGSREAIEQALSCVSCQHDVRINADALRVRHQARLNRLRESAGGLSHALSISR